MKSSIITLKLEDVEAITLKHVLLKHIEQSKKELEEYQSYDNPEYFTHSIAFLKNQIEQCEGLLEKIYRQRPYWYQGLTREEAAQVCKEPIASRAYEKAKAIVEAKERNNEEKNSEHTTQEP